MSKLPLRVTGCIAALLTALCLPALAQDPTLAATPPMGWNSWNHFATKIDDATVRAEADAMVRSGMRDAGYTYVNIDDSWEGSRDANGEIQTNSRFPDMKALADYVHARGLKLGIYSSPGPKTCAGYEGSYGHEAQDARTYARWGINYLKYDLCSLGEAMLKAGSPMKAQAIEVEAYRKMGAALKATGRPIVYSFCQYGIAQVWRWAPQLGGNLWRTTGDISDNYERMAFIGFNQAGLAPFAHPGAWNDPDMLEVGNGGMSEEEYRTHMSLWALLAAPLLAGNDLSTMTAQTRDMLTNREVVAIDQDRDGKQGDRLWAEGMQQIWERPLAGGAKAVGLFNLSGEPALMTLPYSLVGSTPDAMRNVWTHEDIAPKGDGFTTLVPGHGVVLLRLEP